MYESAILEKNGWGYIRGMYYTYIYIYIYVCVDKLLQKAQIRQLHVNDMNDEHAKTSLKMNR